MDRLKLHRFSRRRWPRSLSTIEYTPHPCLSTHAHPRLLLSPSLLHIHHPCFICSLACYCGRATHSLLNSTYIEHSLSPFFLNLMSFISQIQNIFCAASDNQSF
ncbi:hypothetical protein P692DRAFT_20414994 [Suillus brevipes Sb2]|nr:hypothetical protein P692DRAFT_20414994 [Suillus brevipes Sb2]